MPNLLTAAEFLLSSGSGASASGKGTGSPKFAIPSVCVLFGEDEFLMRESFRAVRNAVLSGEDSEFSFSEYTGSEATFSEVIKDVSTVAMFGNGRRLVRIEKADTFLTAARSALEKYVDKPSSSGVLLLELQAFPATTTFYKKVAASGLAVDCRAVKGGPLVNWLMQWASSRISVVMDRSTAALMVDLLGDEPGLLEQEVRRLALMVPPNGTITSQLVSKNVGSWRTRKVWDMLDTALAGNVPGALTQLQQLLGSGETAVGILLMMASTLRRFGTATELYLETERKRMRPNINSILEQAGFKGFVIQKSAEQMKKLGRKRGLQIPALLLQTDLALKGESRADPRLIIETILVKLAAPSLR